MKLLNISKDEKDELTYRISDAVTKPCIDIDGHYVGNPKEMSTIFSVHPSFAFENIVSLLTQSEVRGTNAGTCVVKREEDNGYELSEEGQRIELDNKRCLDVLKLNDYNRTTIANIFEATARKIADTMRNTDYSRERAPEKMAFSDAYEREFLLEVAEIMRE